MTGIEELRRAYQEQRYADAWQVYRVLVDGGQAGPEAHYLGARAARANGDPGAARWILEAIDPLPEGALGGQIVFTIGILCREIGDLRCAVERFQAFLLGLPGYPELEAVAAGAAWYNLGLTQRMLRQFREAVNSYEVACQYFRQESMTLHLCQALHNLAWAACCDGDAGRAAQALEEARPLCDAEYLVRHQEIGEAYLTFVQGQRHQALNMCGRILEAHDQGAEVPPSVVSHACWLAGKVALARGLLAEAETLAKQALHWGQKAGGENRTWNDASDLLQELRRRPQMTGP